jgi:hypothetical protein
MMGRCRSVKIIICCLPRASRLFQCAVRSLIAEEEEEVVGGSGTRGCPVIAVAGHPRASKRMSCLRRVR